MGPAVLILASEHPSADDAGTRIGEFGDDARSWLWHKKCNSITLSHLHATLPAPARPWDTTMSRVRVPNTLPDPEHDHTRCLESSLSRAEAAFDGTGLRLTPLRLSVLTEIAGSHAAIGAYDLLERLARRGGRRLAPISVYRALDSLVEAGLVHRLESRNAYFACHTSHTGERRQIVLCCETCGTVVELTGNDVFERVAAAAAAHGFTPTRTMIEVGGRCSRCAGAAQ